MSIEWMWCFGIALFVYINIQDILPGSWYGDNMFYDQADKVAYNYEREIRKQNQELFAFNLKT